jgi:O-antigen/teichoic acid export membrane protein
MTYQANNIRGHWKRAFCSATLVGFGGIGGIIGSLVFRSQDAPAYHPGLWAAIISQLIIIVIVIGLTFKFMRDNKRVDRGEIQIEGSEQGFKYTL